jgi:thiol:disulfide interchange protein DsbD
MKRLLVTLLLFTASLFAFDQGDILSPEDAFKVEAVKNKEHIKTTIKLGDKIYIYDKMLKYSITKPKEVNLDKDLKRPKPEDFHDFIVFRNKDIVVDIPLSLIKDKVGDGEFTLKIEYQGCSEKGLCYQPLVSEFDFKTKTEVEKTKAIEVKAETPKIIEESSEEDQIVNALKSGSIGTILALFFGFGLFLALTPCIFPMIPILSSIIVSQSGDGKEKMSAGRGLFLSIIYVLAMSIAYTFAGVLAGMFGANIQTAMQNPWVISIFSIVFVALALSMFGYYEIQLPSKLQSKLNKTSDDAKSSGGLMGVAIMGFLSALIVGPCVAPALAGALVYIGQTGDALLGGAALFVMSLGMVYLFLSLGLVLVSLCLVLVAG